MKGYVVLKLSIAVLMAFIIGFMYYTYPSPLETHNQINGNDDSYFTFEYERMNESSVYRVTMVARSGKGLDLDNALPSLTIGDKDKYMFYGNISYTCTDYLEGQDFYLENITIMNESLFGYRTVNVSASILFVDLDLSNNITVGDYFDIEISIGKHDEIYKNTIVFNLVRISNSEGVGFEVLRYNKRILNEDDEILPVGIGGSRWHSIQI